MSINCSKCMDPLGKVFQLLVIVAIILYIASFFSTIGFESNIWLVILIVIYILYLIIEFNSPAFKFLRNKTNELGIKNIMANLIQTPPTIEFYCECYHYETRTVVYSPPKRGGGRKGGSKKRGGKGSRPAGRHRAGGGRRRVRTRRVKITTYTETAYFPYYSARDVSGLFQLDNSREKAMGKVYVKLELTPEINFADELSYMDYDIFRNDFYNRNRRRDQHMYYRETRSVPGLNNFNLVCIRNEEPCGVGVCMFIFCTIIPICELYKCYVNSYCLEQTFKIRKLISTRYNLNEEQKYEYFTPSFDVPAQQYAFQPDNYNYINSNYQVQKPSNEEINKAAMFKDKIPQYECVSYTSIQGQIKVGVVQDDPAYCSVNVNDAPPPNCQDIMPQPGDNRNININMNMNMNPNNNMNSNQNMNQNMNYGLNSNNNLNNNMNNNYTMNNNFNNNQNNEESFEEEDEDEDGAPYSGV